MLNLSRQITLFVTRVCVCVDCVHLLQQGPVQAGPGETGLRVR